MQAETLWRTSAAELEALKKLHDGVHGQLREALDRTSLQDQETIEASLNCGVADTICLEQALQSSTRSQIPTHAAALLSLLSTPCLH